MKIDFSRQEYLALLDILEISDWVLHSHKVEATEETKVYRELEQKIFSHAKDFGCDHLIDASAPDGRLYPTREFEETSAAGDFIESFEEDTFWSQLVEHLAERDLSREVGKDHLSALDQGERWERLEAVESKYWEEFQKNGIERLEIVELPWHEIPDMHSA